MYVYRLIPVCVHMNVCICMCIYMYVVVVADAVVVVVAVALVVVCDIQDTVCSIENRKCSPGAARPDAQKWPAIAFFVRPCLIKDSKCWA